MFKIGYAGFRGEHIPLREPALAGGVSGTDLNQLSPSYHSLGAALLQPAANPDACGAFVSGCTTGQALRPYPQYQNVNADSDVAGDTYYNSLQATFENEGIP